MDKLLEKLKPTSKKVVLIVEKDKDVAAAMADMFHRKGFYVFIESRVENATARLQVLDFTKTRVDLALIHEVDLKTSSYFAKYLHRKYSDIKTVIFDKPEVVDDPPAGIESALLDEGKCLETMTEAMADCLDYSQAALKRHMENLRKMERAWEVDARVKSCLKKGRVPTTIELQAYEANRQMIIKKLAKMFLECFKAETKRYRRFLWKEIKHHMKILKFPVKFSQVRMMLEYYHTETGNFNKWEEKMLNKMASEAA